MYEDLQFVDEMDVVVAEELNDYISVNFPWLPTRMDFSRIPAHIHINWGKATDDEVYDFLNSTLLSNYSHVAVLYAPNEKVKIFELEYATREFDYISLGKQIYVVFGCTRKDEYWDINKNLFAYVHLGADIWAIDKKG